MIKLYKKEEIEKIIQYPKNIVQEVRNIINLLDENYGERDEKAS